MQVDVKLHLSVQAQKKTGYVYLYRIIVCTKKVFFVPDNERSFLLAQLQALKQFIECKNRLNHTKRHINRDYKVFSA